MADRELQEAVAAQLAQARQLSDTQLRALGESGETYQVRISGRIYDINTWSEPVPGDGSGAFAVLVGAWSKSFLGWTKLHFIGFTVSAEGNRIDIHESELWRYD